MPNAAISKSYVQRTPRKGFIYFFGRQNVVQTADVDLLSGVDLCHNNKGRSAPLGNCSAMAPVVAATARPMCRDPPEATLVLRRALGTTVLRRRLFSSEGVRFLSRDSNKAAAPREPRNEKGKKQH
jgi:hypothetical protein